MNTAEIIIIAVVYSVIFIGFAILVYCKCVGFKYCKKNASTSTSDIDMERQFSNIEVIEDYSSFTVNNLQNPRI